MSPPDGHRLPIGAAAHIEALGLERHPEGGWYRRVWVHPACDDGGRAMASSIHYLLAEGERSHWHRIDAAETWCWHAGQPLRLSTSSDGRRIDEIVLGPDVSAGQRLQATVVPNCWQSADLAPEATSTDPTDRASGAAGSGGTDRAPGGERVGGTDWTPGGQWAGGTDQGTTGFALVSCLVVPEFRFDGFEMAPSGWSPG